MGWISATKQALPESFGFQGFMNSTHCLLQQSQISLYDFQFLGEIDLISQNFILLFIDLQAQGTELQINESMAAISIVQEWFCALRNVFDEAEKRDGQLSDLESQSVPQFF